MRYALLLLLLNACSGLATYEIYRPSNYDPKKPTPVVFGFSPFGRAKEVIERVKPAADKYGYVIIASNVSKNGPRAPILRAQDEMWEAAHKEINVDALHLYAAGFSGGGRASMIMADRYPLRGIVSAGSFERVKRPPELVAAIVGDLDGAVSEVHAGIPLDKTHWLTEFKGVHRWPAAELFTEAFDFFERTGGEELMAAAKALEDAGAPHLALRKLQNILSAYPHEPDVVREANRIALQWPGLLQDVTALDAVDLATDKETLDDAFARTRELASKPGPLQERAILQVDRAPDYAAVRATVSMDDATELIAFAQRGAVHASATQMPITYYNIACALAHHHRPLEAMASLRKALDAGFKDRDAIKRDPDLQSLREQPGYDHLVNF